MRYILYFFLFIEQDSISLFFFFQAEDGIRDPLVTGVQTCALPISRRPSQCRKPTRWRRCRLVGGRRCGPQARRSESRPSAGRAQPAPRRPAAPPWPWPGSASAVPVASCCHQDGPAESNRALIRCGLTVAAVQADLAIDRDRVAAGEARAAQALAAGPAGAGQRLQREVGERVRAL